MSEKHNEVIEVPGIRAEDHRDLVAGARVAEADQGLNKFAEDVLAAAEFFRKNRVDNEA